MFFWVYIKTVVGFTSIICVVIYLYLRYTYTYWRRKNIAYIEPTIPLGNVFPVLLRQIPFTEFLAKMYKDLKVLNKDYGGFYISHNKVFVPINPELIKAILVKDFHHFPNRGLHCNPKVDPFSENLVTMVGENWKNNRLKMNPTFSSVKIKAMFQNLLRCSESLVEALEKPSQTQKPIDIEDILGRLTTDFIASCGFGLECNSLKDSSSEFFKYGNLLIKSVFGNHVRIAFFNMFPFLADLLRISLVDREASSFFEDTVKQVVAYREENNVQQKDLIDSYIKMKNQSVGDGDKESFSFKELLCACVAFFVGGRETTAASTTFGMYELASNQDVQAKLREEIFEVLKNNAGEITYDGIMEMTYLDKVVHEILRKYPPISMINRICEHEYTIPGTNTTIDKGVRCWVSNLGLHMDPEYYPEPHKFDPERFSEEEKAKRHPFTYLPFGEGPRICIGKRFGLLQMKVALVRLLKDFEFVLDSKTKVPVEFSLEGSFLSPKDTIWLQCTKISDL